MNIQLTDDSLRIEHRLPATAEKVFRYFTDTALAAKWMAPGDMQCVELEMDVVEGGSYRLTMADAAANSFTSTGTYSEVVPNKRLAYSWQWSHDDSPTTPPPQPPRIRLQCESFTGNVKPACRCSIWKTGSTRATSSDGAVFRSKTTTRAAVGQGRRL